MKLFAKLPIACAALSFIAACSGEPPTVEAHRQGQARDALVSHVEFSDWSPPERLAISTTDFAEITPAISTNGRTLYFASNRTGGIGSNDIWVSRRDDVNDEWGASENLGAPVNSIVVEVGPSVSLDGRLLFFSSSRASSADEVGVCGTGPGTPQPHCDNDIWVSSRECEADGCVWGAPRNLGPGVNTPQFEGGQALWGLHLYFNRGGTANLLPGAPNPGPPADLYASRADLQIVPGEGVSLGFRTAAPVVELNSDAVDQRPTFRLDGREVFFTSARDGTPDIWVSRRRTIFSAWEPPQRLGVINTDAQELHPSLSADGTTLYFASNRTGSPDLYVTRRTRIR